MDANLCEAIASVEARTNRVRENMVQWESVEKMKGKMEKWLGDKETEVRKLRERPAKLHVEAAQMEISHLEVRRLLLLVDGSAVFFGFFSFKLNLKILSLEYIDKMWIVYYASRKNARSVVTGHQSM